MPDKVVRDDLLESDRWLDLPSDTDRLAYFGLLMRADSFGNIEGGSRHLFRLLGTFTQIKSEEACASVLSNLCDVDLVRPWKIDETEREFLHLPRARPTASYLVRKTPPSPWCDTETKLGKHVRNVKKQGLAKNLPVTSQEHNGDMSLGVGVGVGVGVIKPKENTKEIPAPRTNRKRGSTIPTGFCISDRVRAWASEKRHGELDAHFEHFVGWATAKGAKYVDWDQALMNAIRDDWAKLNGGNDGRRTGLQGWWLSEQGTNEQARQLGLSARGGESWQEFRQRIRNSLLLE